MTGPDYILNRQAWALLAAALLFCALCAGLSPAFPGTPSVAVSGIAFAGGFLISMAVIAGFRALRRL